MLLEELEGLVEIESCSGVSETRARRSFSRLAGTSPSADTMVVDFLEPLTAGLAAPFLSLEECSSD